MTDEEITQDDDLFVIACFASKIDASDRQRAKWRRGEGAAWEQRHKARAIRRNRLKKADRWDAEFGKPKTHTE